MNTFDQQLIALALAEDLGEPFRDATTDALFPNNTGRTTAKIISKHPQPIILCGKPVIQAIFAQFHTACQISSDYQEGDIVYPKETLFTLEAEARYLLMAERTILNLLQRLCAVATLTACYVAAITGTACHILDTRKTTPGFRHLEKYAVRCGGGVNHRMGLYDAIMIKDTHVDLLGGMDNALKRLPNNIQQKLPVIVEVRSTLELESVLKHGRDKISRVLLDNMSPELMVQCVQACRGVFPTEASGNVNLETVRAIAETGVDFISVGKITHSAGSVDLSMIC